MASELRRLRLPFLEGLRLGEICHIVHLAIKRRLVAYSGSTLIPGKMHHVCRNASVRIPTIAKGFTERLRDDKDEKFSLSNGDNAKVYVQNEKELCSIVREVLSSVANGQGLDISKLKREVLNRFNIVLSETQFGCTKLLELFQTTSLSRICLVKSVENMHRIHLRENVLECSSKATSPRTTAGMTKLSPQTFANAPVATIAPPPGLEFMVSYSNLCSSSARAGSGAVNLQTSLRDSLRSLGARTLHSLGHRKHGSFDMKTRSNLRRFSYDVQLQACDFDAASTRCPSWGSQECFDLDQSASSAASACSTDEIHGPFFPTDRGASWASILRQGFPPSTTLPAYVSAPSSYSF